MVLNSANIHFDIIMLSETWLASDMGNFDIKGYYCYNYYTSLNNKYLRKFLFTFKNSIIGNDVILGGTNHCSSLGF